jgi:hypothetical protein
MLWIDLDGLAVGSDRLVHVVLLLQDEAHVAVGRRIPGRQRDGLAVVQDGLVQLSGLP